MRLLDHGDHRLFAHVIPMNTRDLEAPVLQRGRRLLDIVHHELAADRPGEGLARLFHCLPDVKRAMRPDEWRQFLDDVVPAHPVLERIHEDPMMRHSYTRPRGYPGDAELIDYLYRVKRPEHSSAWHRALHGWFHGRGPIRGVRYRRELLAGVIDAEADRTDGRARILSVACGHLREALLSGAFRTGWVDELVALDSDERSLAVARATDPELVTPVSLSVARLPRRSTELGSFDLVYSAGLYDYLDERLARSLTTALFGLLRPGGRLVLGNFCRDVHDNAFMEAFMGWSLVERSQPEFEALFDEIPRAERGELRHHVDPWRVFAYVDVRRAGP